MKTYASKDQLVELGISFLKAFKSLEGASKVKVQELCESPVLVRVIAESIVCGQSGADISPHQLTTWVYFYASLGIALDQNTVFIPPHKEGFNRLIVVPKGMTAEKAYVLCTGKFPCEKYTSDSLDSEVPTNDRTADKRSYAIWVRDRVEPDQSNKRMSANMLKDAAVTGITLTERLLLEIKYFAETGKHLDIRNWTLCSGSRFCGGLVPTVGWSYDKLKVKWFNAIHLDDFVRTRVVVSL